MSLIGRQAAYITLTQDDPAGRITVPNYKELKIGMLRRIIHDAGLTVDEFLELL